MSKKTKLWFKVEKMISEKLGLELVPGSGSLTFCNKEDAENIDIICQCKATEGKQITIKKEALTSLFKRSVIQHKIPLFVFHIDSMEYERAKTWVCILLEDYRKEVK